MKSKLLLVGVLPALLAIASFKSLTSQETEDPTLRLDKDLEKHIKETAAGTTSRCLFVLVALTPCDHGLQSGGSHPNRKIS
jgi:hypothetical protein